MPGVPQNGTAERHQVCKTHERQQSCAAPVLARGGALRRAAGYPEGMRLAFVLILIVSACGPAAVRPSDPGAAKLHVASAGLLLPVPSGWHAELAPEPHPVRGHNYASLAKGGITLWLRMSGGPPGYPMDGETLPDPFPLDWSRASASRIDAATQRATLGVGFPLISTFLHAVIPDGTDPAVLGELRDLVRAIAPEPIPDSGVYRDWRAVGALDDFAPGSVTRIAHSARSSSWRPPDVSAFYLVRGTTSVRALIDAADIDFERRCRIAYDAVSEQFACDDGAARWSKHGVPLDGNRALGRYVVAVVSGIVLVGTTTIGGALAPD